MASPANELLEDAYFQALDTVHANYPSMAFSSTDGPQPLSRRVRMWCKACSVHRGPQQGSYVDFMPSILDSTVDAKFIIEGRLGAEVERMFHCNHVQPIARPAVGDFVDEEPTKDRSRTTLTTTAPVIVVYGEPFSGDNRRMSAQTATDIVAKAFRTGAGDEKRPPLLDAARAGFVSPAHAAAVMDALERAGCNQPHVDCIVQELKDGDAGDLWAALHCSACVAKSGIRVRRSDSATLQVAELVRTFQCVHVNAGYAAAVGPNFQQQIGADFIEQACRRMLSAAYDLAYPGKGYGAIIDAALTFATSGLLIDGLPLETCFAEYALQQKDVKRATALTQAQLIVARYMWRAKLRERVEKTKRAERNQVLCDVQDID